jgi:hypothetical protein
MISASLGNTFFPGIHFLCFPVPKQKRHLPVPLHVLHFFSIFNPEPLHSSQTPVPLHLTQLGSRTKLGSLYLFSGAIQQDDNKTINQKSTKNIIDRLI